MKTVLVCAAAALSVLAQPAAAGPRARLIEAYAAAPFDKATPLRIVPISQEQADDPTFVRLANLLGETLTKQGFNLAPGDKTTPVVLTLEYRAEPVILSVALQNSVNDSAYRMMIVTAFDMKDSSAPTLAWQTAMDEYGITTDPMKSIPGLIKSAAPHFGVGKTPIGLNKAAWCSDNTPLAGMRVAYSCKAYSPRPLPRYAGTLLANRGDYVPVAATQ